jgi:CHASE3 domain sensor protein
MHLTSVQKFSMYSGAALIVLGIFGGMSYYFSSRLVESDRAVERANTNMSNAFRLVTARQEAVRLSKAYVVRPDTETHGLLQGAQSQVEDAIDAMAKGTEDNPHQVRLMKELANRAAESFETFRATLLVRDRAGSDAARRMLSRALPELDADTLMALVAHFRSEELRVLAEQTRLQSAHSETAQRVILFGMVLTFLLAAVALQPMRSGVSSRLTSQIVREHESAGGAQSEPGRVRAEVTAQIRAMHRFADAIAVARDPAAVAQAVVRAATSALDPALAAVVAPDALGGLAVLASSNDGFTSVDAILAAPIADALRTDTTAMGSSRRERDQQWNQLPSLDAVGATGAVLFVPLTGVQAVAGVLLVVRADDHVFGDDDLLFAATLGRLGGPALTSRPPA